MGTAHWERSGVAEDGEVGCTGGSRAPEDGPAGDRRVRVNKGTVDPTRGGGHRRSGVTGATSGRATSGRTPSRHHRRGERGRDTPGARRAAGGVGRSSADPVRIGGVSGTEEVPGYH